MWIWFLVFLNCVFNVCGDESKYNILQWNITNQLYGKKTLNLSQTGVILKDNKPLHIILENYEFHPSNVTCRNNIQEYNFSTEFQIIRENGKNHLIIMVNVTDDMSTEWLCTALINGNEHRNFIFKLHIKGLVRVNAVIGRVQIPGYQLTDVTVLDHDGVAEYWYMAGEVIDLVCQTEVKVNHEGYIRLKYYTETGKKLLETEEIEAKYPVNLRKSIYIDNDNDHIDCSYISKAGIEYTYRTILRLKSGSNSENPLIITINGVKLFPAQSNSINEEYQYKFHDGQILNITCEMNKNIPGDLTLDAQSLGSATKVTSETLNWKSSKIFKATRDMNLKSVRCLTTANQYSAEIFLLSEQIDPILTGLSPKDTIHQYSKNPTTWITDYWYTANQTLNLTCVSRTHNQYQWSLKNRFKQTHVTGIGAESNHIFHLKQDYNCTSIICNVTHRIAIVNLYLKSESPTKTIINKDGSLPHLTLIVGCAVAMLTIALVVVCITICTRIRKRKRLQRESSENYTRDLDIPIPAYRNQWADSSAAYEYIYTQDGTMRTNSLYNMNSADSYVRPQQKAKRLAEPVYQEIEDRQYERPVNNIGDAQYPQMATYNNLKSPKEPFYHEISSSR